MNSIVISKANQLARTLGMDGEGTSLVNTLKATAFRSQTPATDAQMAALMIVASQYRLNPWTREIYAFPDKGGIVPVVGVDGWSRIMNEHPQFDGLEFQQSDDSCTAIIYRKDRNHPVSVTEYLSECKRNTGPWQSHPKRMLRHKAMIQAARLAFGFVGIFDPDEAERITEKNAGTFQQAEVIEAEVVDKPLQSISNERLEKAVQKIAAGEYTLDQLLANFALEPAQIEYLESSSVMNPVAA